MPNGRYPSKDGKIYPTLQKAAAADAAFSKRTKAAGRVPTKTAPTRTVTMWVDPTGQMPPTMNPPQSPTGRIPGMEDMGAFAENARAMEGAKTARHPLDSARAALLAEIMARPEDEFYSYMPMQRGPVNDVPWNFGGQGMTGTTRGDPYLPGGSSAQYAPSHYRGPYEATQVQNNDGSPAGPISGPGPQVSASAIASYILNAWEDPLLQGNMTQANLDFLRGLR